MMTKEPTTLEVSALQNGTVLDHLPSEKVLKLLTLLNVADDRTVTVGMNLKSKTLARKGVIKLSERHLDEKELNKVAILAPEATLNMIQNYKVIQKKKIELRGIEEGIIRCNNPHCITNHETIFTRFLIMAKTPLALRCFYCERMVKEQEIHLM